ERRGSRQGGSGTGAEEGRRRREGGRAVPRPLLGARAGAFAQAAGAIGDGVSIFSPERAFLPAQGEALGIRDVGMMEPRRGERTFFRPYGAPNHHAPDTQGF